jgi:hypothetical protein
MLLVATGMVKVSEDRGRVQGKNANRLVYWGAGKIVK